MPKLWKFVFQSAQLWQIITLWFFIQGVQNYIELRELPKILEKEEEKLKFGEKKEEKEGKKCKQHEGGVC